MAIERFEDLKSWQKARKLTELVYRLTRKDPFSGDRGLSWQIQDAAVSRMGNIAETYGRFSFEDKRRFLDISMGSCKEAQSHLCAALDQSYISQSEFDDAYDQAQVVDQLVNGAIENLDRQIASRSPARPGPRRRP